MNIFEIPKTEIDKIRDLWFELNLLHHEKSTYFKDHFKGMSFDKRKKSLLKKDRLIIYVLGNEKQLSGYCIASVTEDAGEIDSLFVRSETRHLGYGNQLTEKALKWLEKQNCSSIKVAVAEGNESALKFYEKNGFKHRFYIMQK